jgi:AcrR family transcriptional regulator
MLDPSVHRTAPRRPGRPSATSMPALVDTAIDVGLDSFTLATVAARVGVGESTVYGYVASRDELFTAAAATVFERLDIDSDARTWSDYVDTIAQRTFDLAADNPGLREYVLWGPYAATTVTTFETLVARVQAWLPDIPEHLAWVLASRPVVLSLGYLGDPVLEPMAPWLRRALLRGMADLLATEPPPPAPAASWRAKLRPPA